MYSECPEHWNLLYLKSSRFDRIRLGCTGYIAREWVDDWSNRKATLSRNTDVSYRVSKRPAHSFSLGQLRWEVAGLFINASSSISRLKTDISIDPKDLGLGRR